MNVETITTTLVSTW